MITRINIGPIHPGVHGALRLLVDLDGDTIADVEPHVGFLHRGVEKLMEGRRYMQNMPYVEKLDYVAPMAYDDAYVSALEGVLGTEVKEKALYARTALLEMQRIASHLMWLGTFSRGLGISPTFYMWCLRDRDEVLKLLEEATGARMSYMNMRIGGLARNLPSGFEGSAMNLLSYIRDRTSKYESFLEKDSLFNDRLTGIGMLSGERAVQLGVTGPVLRASGVNYDIRRDKPYYVYGKLNFKTQIRRDCDCFARYKVRMMEIRESIRIASIAFEQMPEGDAAGSPARLILPEYKNQTRDCEQGGAQGRDNDPHGRGQAEAVQGGDTLPVLHKPLRAAGDGQGKQVLRPVHDT